MWGLKDALAGALEAKERWERTAAELRKENERLRAENGRLREETSGCVSVTRSERADLERVNAEPAVPRRLVFGRFGSAVSPSGRGARGGGRGRSGQSGR